MPRIGVFSGKEICSILAKCGFVHVRSKGSHAILQHTDEEGRTRSVPVPLHSEIKKGTLRSIIRQSGLDAGMFMK